MKLRKLIISSMLVIAIFSLTSQKAYAISIDEIKSQIAIIASKLTEIQKQLDEIIKTELATGTTKSIVLLSPVGAETLEVGKTFEIKWDSTGFSPDSEVQIKLFDERYSRDSAQGTIDIAKISNTGSYMWSIPNSLKNFLLYGSLYKIAIYVGEEKSSQSNYLEIYQPIQSYLKVVSPSGGESLEQGKTFRIKWDSLGFKDKKVNIILKRYNLNAGGTALDSVSSQIVADHIANKSYYDWAVTSDLTGSRMKIGIDFYDKYENNVASELNNSYFTIY